MAEETSSDRHNRLAAEFVQKIVREELKAGGDYASLLVILESICLGIMLINKEMFGMRARQSAELVEQAADRAMDRFVALQKEKPNG